jgi:hypothetical protein
MSEYCEHKRELCSECIHVSDTAKRAYDIVRSYTAFVEYDERVRSWVALRLEDGGSDGVLYLSKQDAIRHQAHEQLCAYFSYRTAPTGFGNARDAAVWLEFHRMAYDSGFRLADPDDSTGGPDLIMPSANEVLGAQFSTLRDWGK